jgi:hypothetical protein
MINPNALPTSPTVQDFQNFESAVDSPDYNNTLNAMRYMQGQRTGGLNRLPQVTVPMQEGGMMEEAMMEQQAPMNPEEAMLMEQVKQQDPRQPNPEAMAMAQQVASYGRGGDKLLLHVRPDELQGLASMLTITINPETGMPEAFLKGLRRAVSRVTKPIRKITKSKAFKTIAPIALAIAAPYILPQLAAGVGLGTVGVGGAAGTGLAGFLGGSSIGATFATTGLGSLAGNLLAGRKFGDAAKAALISGATAGALKGVGNVRAGKTFFGGQTPIESATYGTYRDLSSKGLVESVNKVGVGGSPFKPSVDSVDIRGFDPNLGSYGEAAGVKAVDGVLGQAPLSAVGQTQDSVIQEAIRSQNPTLQALKQGTEIAKGNVQPTFISRFKEGVGSAKDALVSGVKDRYSGLTSFDKGALMNLGKDVLTADIGASAVEMDNAQQQALEDQQLADAGYSVAYPSGFGTQRVIRDSSGVVVNATAQDILARALGGGRMQFAPQTTFAPTAVAAQGGLIELAQGGEFSGMVPGQGSGMDDNVYMPIKEGTEQVGTLAVSPSEYVVDSYTMAALGDGNPAEGARVMDKTIKQIRKKAYGDTQQPNEIDGLAALKPMVQGV